MDEEFFGFGGFGDGVLDCAVGEGFHLGVLGLGGLEHLVDYLGGYLGDFGVWIWVGTGVWGGNTDCICESGWPGTFPKVGMVGSEQACELDGLKSLRKAFFQGAMRSVW